MDKVAPAPAGQVPPPPEGGPGTRRGGPAAWTLVDCGGVFLLTIFIAGAVSAVLGFALAVTSGGAPDGGTPDALPLSRDMLTVVSQVVFFVVLIATVFGWVRLRYSGHARALVGAASPGRRDLLLGLGLGVLAFVVLNVGLGTAVEALARLAGAEPPAVQENLQQLASNPETAPFFIVMAVVFAPVAEELFFRGMLYPAFAKRLGVWSAIVVTALLFALLHGVEPLLMADLGQSALVIGLIFPLGLLLAWAYHRRGTLLVPILIHATFNLIAAVGLTLL